MTSILALDKRISKNQNDLLALAMVFVKLENKHYTLSRVFAPLSTQSELESACQILRKIAETIK
jgi:hypothetical protein